MRKIYKKLWRFSGVIMTVYICNLFNSVNACKVHDVEIHPIIAESLEEEDLKLARAKVVESFRELGNVYCVYGEIVRDLDNIVKDSVESYKNFVDQKIESEYKECIFGYTIKKKVGGGLQALEFLKNWNNNKEVQKLQKGKSLKQIFIDEYSNLSGYSEYLENMYNFIITPIEEIWDILNEIIKNEEYKYFCVKKYAIEINKIVSEPKRKIEEEKLKEKMASMDFSKYDYIKENEQTKLKSNDVKNQKSSNTKVLKPIAVRRIKNVNK